MIRDTLEMCAEVLAGFLVASCIVACVIILHVMVWI